MPRRARLLLLTGLAAGEILAASSPASATDGAACPKIAQSFQSDPATGCLLALAACHAEEGKSATAWSEYRDAIERAEREGRADRAEIARRRSAALEGRLSRLAVTLSPGAGRIRGLVVRRDGGVLPADSFGAPVPVDPGPHAIEASAPGYETWSERVIVAGDGGASSVVVPTLVEAPTWASTDGVSPLQGKTPLQTVGMATGAVALVAFAVSGYLTVRAVDRNNASQGDCANDACGPGGKQARLDAIAAANGASVTFAIGAVLAAGGVTLFLLGEPGTARRIAVAPVVGPGAAGVRLEAGF